jgi:tetratricopeptide (TPR) repeat protein
MLWEGTSIQTVDVLLCLLCTTRFPMATFALPDDATCGICLEVIVDPYVLDCDHTFFRGCINEYRERGINDLCPYCRAPLPPGVAECVDGCIKMGARITRYEATGGNTKRIGIAWKCQLHYARKGVNADPNLATARFYLALGLETVDEDYGGAEREYREAIRCHPNDASAHFNLGRLMLFRKNYDGAGREYCEAIRCKPNSAVAHLSFGALLYHESKDYDGAEHEYREAIRCDPNNAAAHFCLGALLHIVREDYDGAEHESREAIRCDSNDAGAHCNLGLLLYEMRKDSDGAERAFREAIRCDRNHKTALEGLSEVLALKEDCRAGGGGGAR